MTDAVEKMESSRTLIVPNRIEEIRTIERFLVEFSEQHDFPPETLFQIQLSLEEMFTNVVSYGYDDDTEHEIEIVLSRNGKTVTVEIADDGRPFDPLKDAPEMDAESALAERRVGGAGIALTKTMMTDLRYHRDDGRNHLIMVKDL
ncbi:MAG: ATP-binding protein [Gammaproteobacteria bacterium]|nr:ATP-binding protein [Gammaproteobacteria bacterium]